MNTTIRNTALAAIMFAAASGAAFAQSTANLQVTGKIVPAACTPTLSGGGVVDYGNIVADSLSATGVTKLPVKNLTMTISCSAATKIGFTTTDNQHSTIISAVGSALAGFSLSDTNMYGFGATNGKSIGTFIVKFGNTLAGTTATADGSAIDTIYSQDAGVSWRGDSGNWGQPTGRVHSWAPVGTMSPGTYKTITQPIMIEGGIAKIGDLPPLTNDVPLNGSVTFSISYL